MRMWNETQEPQISVMEMCCLRDVFCVKKDGEGNAGVCENTGVSVTAKRLDCEVV